jgi:hypothetical protein
MELWQMGIISFFAWPSSEVSHHVCLCSVFLVAKKANCIARALTAEAVVELPLPTQLGHEPSIPGVGIIN